GPFPTPSSPANNIKGPAIMMRKTCSEMTSSGEEGVGKGPRPWSAYQVERKEKPKRQPLTPAIPKRTDAHSRKGKGIYNRAGELSWLAELPKARKVTATSPMSSNPAST